MSKKCLRCGAPLDGFFAKIAGLAGVKPSEKNPDYCNKCESLIPTEGNNQDSVNVEAKSEEPKAVEPTPVTTETQPIPENPPMAPETPKAPEEELKLNTEEPKDIFADTDKTI